MLSTLPALPTLNTPPATPQTPHAPAAPETADDGRAFARQLQDAQRQEGEPKPASATPHARATTPKGPARAARMASEPADGDAPGKATVTPVGTPLPPQGAKVAADTAAEVDEGADANTTTPSTGDADSPQDLSALLAHLRGHNPPAAPARAAATPAEEAGAADTPRGQVRTRAPAADGATPAPANAVPAADKALPRGADATARSPLASFQDTLAQATAPVNAAATDEHQAQALPAADSNGTAVPLPQATGAPAAPARAEATPVQQTLSARLDSADFAPQLGAQISTFVRDGVEHAQLHLNPAEMGPVTVQIQLEGQGARVHLLADQAPTRQALEQAMPQLAGSLREAGLTLTGGGVFQQPRQSQGEAARGEPDRGRGGVAAVGAREADEHGRAALAAVPTLRRRGVVDLVA